MKCQFIYQVYTSSFKKFFVVHFFKLGNRNVRHSLWHLAIRVVVPFTPTPNMGVPNIC